MKPRIKLWVGHSKLFPIWQCEGLGRRGLGEDPDDAYWAWVALGSEVW